jgi:hypothetical protein
MRLVNLNEDPNGGFDALSMLQQAEMKLAYVMYACGMNPQDLSTTTIDEIVGAIRESFPKYSDVSPGLEPTKHVILKYSFILVSAARRAWFDRQIALAEVGNG